MYSLIGICTCLVVYFTVTAICGANMKVYSNTPVCTLSTISIALLSVLAFILGCMYADENPENWSAEQKLEYIESGKEIPKERDKKYDEQYDDGWHIGFYSAIGSFIAFGIYTFCLTHTKKCKRDKYRDKLRDKRRQLEHIRYDLVGDEEHRKIVIAAIDTIDKTLNNLEWQEKLEKVKNSLSLIEDIKKDDSWKDLQAEIDKLEAFIELSGGEYLDEV